MVGFNVVYFIGFNIFYGNTLALKYVPYGAVEENTFGVFAGKRFGNIETTHTTKFLLLFKKEELVRLHIKLTSNGGVIVDYNIFNTMLK